MTDGQIESQRGFFNDCKAWGEWMAEREREPAVLDAVRRLGAEPILTYITEGMKESDVRWVMPSQLREAAAKLRQAIEAGRTEAAIILRSYERNANRVDPVAEEFLHDLEDITALALWAEEEGATRMTLEVNW